MLSFWYAKIKRRSSARLNIVHFGPRQRRWTSTPRTCILSKLRERKTPCTHTEFKCNGETCVSETTFRLLPAREWYFYDSANHSPHEQSYRDRENSKAFSNAPRVRSVSTESAQLVSTYKPLLATKGLCSFLTTYSYSMTFPVTANQPPDPPPSSIHPRYSRIFARIFVAFQHPNRRFECVAIVYRLRVQRDYVTRTPN